MGKMYFAVSFIMLVTISLPSDATEQRTSFFVYKAGYVTAVITVRHFT